jgi:hypothetical protein
VSHIYLRDREGSAVDAELWDAITDKNLADWEAEWLPELFRVLQQLNRAGVERRLWPQSRHWDWRAKLKGIEGLLSQPCFSVVCQGVTQGMMIANTTKRARIQSQRNQHLVYVEYLESAPWNRKTLLASGQAAFGGIGSILMRAAIEVSLNEEYKGRVGLHSLPQANDFYANTCDMTDLGPDANYENLRYYEFTPEQAQAFINRGNDK